MTMAVQDTKKKALGRGLESLIPAAAARAVPPAPQAAQVQPGEAVVDLALEEIEASPYQPRRKKDQRPLEELAASIRVSGVMQPILVRRIGAGTVRLSHTAPTTGERVGHPADGGAAAQTSKPGSSGAPGESSVEDGATAGKGDGAAHAGASLASLRTGCVPQVKYQLIAGERRWLASKMAGKTTVPAIVREVSNEHAMELALVENLQREDLGTMEMAHAFDRLNRDFGLTQEQISQRTGKDRATIGNYLRLLKLGPSIQEAIEEGKISFGHAKALLALESREMIGLAAAEIIEHAYSVRQAEEFVKRMIWERPLPEEEKKIKTQLPRPVDPNVRAAERQLEESLGTRVKILDRHGKGKVVIEYATLEDFDRIVEMLSK